MNTVILWLLIATASAGSNSRTPLLIDRFTTAADCEAAASRMSSRSMATMGVANLTGICVEARVYKP